MGILYWIMSSYRPATEKEVRKDSLRSEVLKGYRIYFFREEADGYREMETLTAVAYRNGRFICHCERKKKKGLPLEEKDFERLREGIGSLVYTEEEILSPNPSLSEYKRKKAFLERLYIMQAEHLPLENVQRYEDYAGLDGMIFDPVSSCALPSNQKEFVEHHIWLYQELQKRFRPTIFPVEEDLKMSSLVFAYAKTIPLADPDDLFLEEAKEYLKKNGGREALLMYEYGSRDTALNLAAGGFVAKPTMKKLLEIANEREDAEFAAVLLERMQGSGKSASRFAV